ncbi:MAG: TonB-dependent receptor, partial [Bacteroidota bacterium]
QLYLRSEYAGKYFRLDVQGGYCDKAFGAQSFYSAKYPDQFENIVMQFASATLSTLKAKNLSLKYYFRRLQDKFELFRESPPSWYAGHNYHLTYTNGADLNYHFSWFAGNTSLGATYRSEQIYSNVLGDRMSKPISVNGESGIFYTRSKYRNDMGLFLDHSYTYKNFRIDAGIMGNYFSQKTMQYFPGIDISYKPLNNLNCIISYNKSFRLPTFTDLYYSGPSNQGNLNLKPEEAQTIEAGVRYHKKAIEANLSFFQRWGTNMIDWVKYPDSTKWTTMNLTSVDVSGCELTLQWHLDYFSDKFFIKTIGLNYGYNNISKHSAGNFISYYVLDGIKQKITLTLRHESLHHLFFNWYLHYQDRYGSYTDIKTNLQADYKPFLSLDAKATYEILPFNFFIECNNITNAMYYDFGNILMPGRWIKGGITFDIDFNKK